MKRPLIRCVVVLLAALLIALTVGRFWVGRYAVATRAMQPALRPGDRVAVDKRGTPIRRGAIVLYRSPRAQDGDALHFGRCVGLPGDTVTVTPDGYLIHGHLYPAPADILDTYRVPRDLRLSLLSLLFSLDIPIRHLSDDTAHFCLCLTSTEAHRVRELLPRMLRPPMRCLASGSPSPQPDRTTPSTPPLSASVARPCSAKHRVGPLSVPVASISTVTPPTATASATITTGSWPTTPTLPSTPDTSVPSPARPSSAPSSDGD